jgi:hypothetical protein
MITPLRLTLPALAATALLASACGSSSKSTSVATVAGATGVTAVTGAQAAVIPPTPGTVNKAGEASAKPIQTAAAQTPASYRVAVSMLCNASNVQISRLPTLSGNPSPTPQDIETLERADNFDVTALSSVHATPVPPSMQALVTRWLAVLDAEKTLEGKFVSLILNGNESQAAPIESEGPALSAQAHALATKLGLPACAQTVEPGQRYTAPPA